MEKLWKRSLKLEKENTEMKILGANETMTQKPWYILSHVVSHAEQESYFKQKRLELRKQELALQQERQEQQQQRNLFQQQMMQ